MSAKKRILSIVFNDLRNDNRVLNQAFSLASQSYDVTLIGIQRQTKLPTSEISSMVRIVRIFMKNDFIEQIRYVRAIYFIVYIWLQIFKRRKNRYDVIHCHDLNTLQFGVFLKFLMLRKPKLVYDAHEYETQRNGLHGFWQKFAIIKERMLIKRVDRVITVSPTIAKEYVRLYRIPEPAVILNCPILRVKEITKNNLFREHFGIPEDYRIFLYQGYLYPGRGIEIILEAFDQLNLSDAALVFMGEGNLTDLIKRHDKYNQSIFIQPFVSGDVLLKYTSSADFGIAFIEDISLSDRYCLPNKLFEYIAAGLPVIGSGLPDIRQFITTHQVGTVAQTNDVEGFIEAFHSMSRQDPDDLKENIRNTRNKYHWGTQEQVLLSVYQQIMD
jgi:glycosyltransferase involved in cell wall biosynthesis